jgi:hypothetical protein
MFVLMVRDSWQQLVLLQRGTGHVYHPEKRETDSFL